MSYTLTIPISLGQSQTGLTLRAQLQDVAKTSVGSPITTGFIEEGGGVYGWTGPIPNGHRGYVRFELLDGTFRALAGIDGTEEAMLGAAVGGSGPYAMIVTVADVSSHAAIPGATVSARGNQVAGATANGSGNAVLNLTDGAVSVLVTAPGYANSAVLAEVVSSGDWVSSGTGTLVVTLMATAAVVAPGPGQITAITSTYDEAGNLEAGVTVKYRLVSLPASVTTGVFDDGVKSLASGTGGLWQKPIIMGATYSFWTRSGREVEVVVPTSGTSFALDPVIGRSS